jgi:hypothetical protein
VSPSLRNGASAACAVGRSAIRKGYELDMNLVRKFHQRHGETDERQLDAGEGKS